MIEVKDNNRFVKYNFKILNLLCLYCIIYINILFYFWKILLVTYNNLLDSIKVLT